MHNQQLLWCSKTWEGEETDIPGESILKVWARGWGLSLLQLLSPGLEEGSVRGGALASFGRRGEGNSNQEALGAQGSGFGQRGAERRDL